MRAASAVAMLLLAGGATAAATPAPTDAAEVYKCFTEGGCVKVSAGTDGAQTKERCEATCGKPTPAPPATPSPPAAKVYGCDSDTFTCKEVPAGTAGAQSRALCDQMCRKTPAPPPTPKPTLAPVYLCNMKTFSCDEVPAYTPGSGAKDLCEASCKKTPAPPPTPAPTSAKVYTCDAGTKKCSEAAPGTAGASSKKVCEDSCGKSSPSPSPASVYMCNATSKACEVVPDGTPGSTSLPLCTQQAGPCFAKANCTASLDILFVLDGSGSIDLASWSIDTAATQAISNAFSFGNGTDGVSAEMGIVQFSEKVEVVQQLTADKSQFDKSLAGMQKMKSYTYTGDALEAAQAELAARGRPGVFQAVVLVTDGVPCTAATVTECNKEVNPVPDPTQAKKAAEKAAALKAGGVTVTSVAVGNFGTNGMSFINSISSQPSSKYVFNPQTWQQLPALINGIVKSVCP